MNAESVIRFSDDMVTKTYNATYYKLNRCYKRKGEPYWYRRLTSDFLLKPYKITDEYVILPRGKGVMGPEERLELLQEEKARELYIWLGRLVVELGRLGVEHHDIHPANILQMPDGSYRLIDLGWMTRLGAKFEGEPYLNLSYSRNDSRATMKLKCEIVGMGTDKEVL